MEATSLPVVEVRSAYRLPSPNPTLWDYVRSVVVATTLFIIFIIAMACSLLYSLLIPALNCFTCIKGLSELTCLPSQGRVKVSVHITLPRPILWDYTRYVVGERYGMSRKIYILV